MILSQQDDNFCFKDCPYSQIQLCRCLITWAGAPTAIAMEKKWRNFERAIRKKKSQFTFHNFTICANTNTIYIRLLVLRGLSIIESFWKHWFMAQPQLNHRADGNNNKSPQLNLFISLKLIYFQMPIYLFLYRRRWENLARRISVQSVK